ncbi:MAG: hypothetical protein GW780_00145 [Candidatus Aenigmarchaeota archaeon]|nr:hypothetical protein [Candidatus Aenigmarchaeota archaeon]OIN87230.1 MAG: hypothetical protein AUJ50_02935 [Candidatus Aenigmarchaeota archaeon CG1_02_38_14]PIV69595.1 MAG: hypothetical protein COS07_00175 [Candidatus Aenigmarchaeota archaeon CG01_land_8_20_14_3_00_37_9]PIX51005.1 MAG: hypothetical protein COZ52_01210 [Candidatus Aenigmarchaeota archaeon CG_4_8_14_3_um_filter_37_24]PIY35675.1 MAG: hypothetical protein COZ04_02565 [Candidatus Aenigmarchaeota archaeon CG_4_10_14_3_um_filter_37
MTFTFKHFEDKLLKVGKVVLHRTRTKSKEYRKSKIYLDDDSNVDKRYELYDIGKVDVIEWHGKIKGKGLLVFFPDKPRLKKDIRN